MTRSARNGSSYCSWSRLGSGYGKRLVFLKGGTGQVYDAGMLSPTFFRVPRSKSGLDSRDSRRIGLGLSPVGRCSLPFREQGHCMRVEIDASNQGFGLILGDSGRRFWFRMGLLRVRSWAGARDSQGSPPGLEKNSEKEGFSGLSPKKPANLLFWFCNLCFLR